MNSITGINGLPYINLERFIDLESFDRLLPEICRGLSTAKNHIIEGSQIINDGSINPNSQGISINPLYDTYKKWNQLPDTDPLKQAGKDLNYNQLTAYLKFAFGGYDLYSRYVLFEDCKDEIILKESAEHFPNLIKWIISLKEKNIFRQISGASLFLLEAGGIPYEHCDPAKTPEELKYVPEFIHIKTDLDRPFYIIDKSSREKFYIDSRVAWWNERDWHGGEPVYKPTFTFRVDGKFTNEFKEKIFNRHA